MPNERLRRDDTRAEESPLPAPDAPPWFRLKAALVHMYTASGIVLALLILASAFRGDAVGALWLMLAALVIDSTDGLLARRFRVGEALPSFDGAMLDNIVDFMTYVFAPIVLLWSGGYLPTGMPGLVLAAVPLLASSYQFCHEDAKTEDYFFRGFPSYFNVVAFYAIVFALGPVILGAVLVVCSLLVFASIRYVYPTRTIAFRGLSLSLTTLWLAGCGAILLQMPEPEPVILALSLLYLAYYFGMSLYLSAKMMLEERSVKGQPEP